VARPKRRHRRKLDDPIVPISAERFNWALAERDGSLLSFARRVFPEVRGHHQSTLHGLLRATRARCRKSLRAKIAREFHRTETWIAGEGPLLSRQEAEWTSGVSERVWRDFREQAARSLARDTLGEEMQQLLEVLASPTVWRRHLLHGQARSRAWASTDSQAVALIDALAGILGPWLRGDMRLDHKALRNLVRLLATRPRPSGRPARRK
jgi:hypothetical protein